MKKPCCHNTQVLWLLLLLIVAACSNNPFEQPQMGTLVIGNLGIDYTFATEGATRGINNDPNAPSPSAFTIEVVDSYGTVVKSGSLQDFTTPFFLFETTYIVRAFYGNPETEIGNQPYYYGETSVDVKANETSYATPITATLQSAMVSADISALSSHFTATPKVYVSTASSKIELPTGGWLYLKPDQSFTLSLEGTNQAGIAVSPTLKTWTPVKRTAYSINVTPDLPIITLPDQQPGAWAKRLYITPATATNSLGTPISLPKGTVYELIPASSSDWNAAITSTTDANGLQVITGLNSDTNYKVRARVGTIVSDTHTITTEVEASIPNGNMEIWNSTNGKKFLWNIYWYHWYARSETSESNEGWCTRNDLTTSSDSYLAYVANSGTERTSTCYKGNYAAEIKTIGWGSGNTAAGSASTIKNITPGELFLGKVTDINAPSYGYTFTSRPSRLSFYYKYQPSGSHTFSVDFIVKDANDNIIAQETFNGESQSDYIKKEIVLDYQTNCYTQPNSICINFNSGENSKSEVATANMSNGSRHTGNKLYIDEIELIYD